MPQSTPPLQPAKLKERVPVVDHAGVLLQYVTAEQAEQLIREKRVDVLRTKKRIRKLRWRTAEPDMSNRRFFVRRPGFGMPHRRETYDNPRGVWTLQRLPESTRPIFTKVLDDVTKRAA